MKTFVITGGTGFMGRAMVAAILERGDAARVITRSTDRARKVFPQTDRLALVEGDPVYAGPWQEAVSGSDVMIGLAGESVANKRWDARFRQVLHDSRIDSTRHLVEAAAACAESDRPKVFASASGIDYYPFALDLGRHTSFGEDDEIDETAPPGDSFLARLCRHWEDEAQRAKDHGLRVVTLRTGLVLGEGGPLDKMTTPFKFFAGGRLGSGRQWVTWIHLTDAVNAYLFAIACDDLEGPVNLVAPNPVRNRELSTAIGKALRRPSFFPAPKFALHVALGEFAEYIVHGRRAVPAELARAGFEFAHPDVTTAVAAALRS